MTGTLIVKPPASSPIEAPLSAAVPEAAPAAVVQPPGGGGSITVPVAEGNAAKAAPTLALVASAVMANMMLGRRIR